MQPTITVIRAIGVELARRLLLPFIVVGGLVTIALLTLGGWLTTQSAWWWLLEVAFIIGTILFVVAVVGVFLVLRAVAPSLSRKQKRSVASFVDKLERVAENVGTPQVFIIYRVVRDTIHPKRDGFIQTLAEDSKTLAPDFVRLRKEFERDTA